MKKRKMPPQWVAFVGYRVSAVSRKRETAERRNLSLLARRLWFLVKVKPTETGHRLVSCFLYKEYPALDAGFRKC